MGEIDRSHSAAANLAIDAKMLGERADACHARRHQPYGA
jgi:hypothetical protein